MLHYFFTPKFPKGDFRYLPLNTILATRVPFGGLGVRNTTINNCHYLFLPFYNFFLHNLILSNHLIIQGTFSPTILHGEVLLLQILFRKCPGLSAAKGRALFVFHKCQAVPKVPSLSVLLLNG